MAETLYLIFRPHCEHCVHCVKDWVHTRSQNFTPALLCDPQISGCCLLWWRRKERLSQHSFQITAW